MHGYGALASFLPGGMLHAEAMYLRERGVPAYAPHVNPYETVAARTVQWENRLERVFEETSAERVNLVGFSLGGLDARHIASDQRWVGRIASIVTVATPHRGTPLASYLLEGSERLAWWSIQAMGLMGKAAWKDDPPNVAASLAELTPAHVTEVFDPAHPLPKDVWCASYSARAVAGIYPPLRVSLRILTQLAGENDGLVPTVSAIWAEHLGTVEADHARLVGLRAGKGLDSREFYLRVTGELRERGF
jgi:triacylglycerol lipase